MKEPNDLAFSSGEIIEIVDETNADWWTGKCRGRQGLFPSNHVEKINTPAATSPAPAIPSAAPWVPTVGASAAPPSYQTPPGGYQGYGQEKPVYRPFGAAYHGADQPPPASGVNSVGLQHNDQEHEKKKSKFGKLGNTVSLVSYSVWTKLEEFVPRWPLLPLEVLVLELVSSFPRVIIGCFDSYIVRCRYWKWYCRCNLLGTIF